MPFAAFARMYGKGGLALEIHKQSAALFSRCEEVRRSSRSVWLVPTMGGLHRGHAALIKSARRDPSDFVVVSIFLNPSQFAENEDFSSYPQEPEADLHLCESLGVDAVYLPSKESIYPDGFQTFVQPGELAERLEGSFRPIFFRGVCTVVTKLFSSVGSCQAVFGRKDYQQLKVVEQLVRDLNLPVRIVGHPIVREEDGLACSTRNAYLSTGERKRALKINETLRFAEGLWKEGRYPARVVEEKSREKLAPFVDKVDYLSLVAPNTLVPVTSLPEELACDEAMLLVAAYVGTTRLIDNILLPRRSS